MGLCYQTTKWSDMLWKDHVSVSREARNTVNAADLKYREFSKFAEDVHYKLYVNGDHKVNDKAPNWSKELLTQSEQLGEWQRLKKLTAKNPFASGIATETVLKELVKNLPNPDSEQGFQGGSGSGGQEVEQAVRRAVRCATRCATEAIEEAESTMEGLKDLLGVKAGSEFQEMTLNDVHDFTVAYNKIKDNHFIKRVVQLAGRLERLANSKKKTKVKKACGQIHGIEQGSDLSRLLPSELIGLKNKKLRLLTLSKIMQRKSLQYALEGKEPLSKGPVVILLDQSSSMYGEPDEWAKAVVLAILSTVIKEKREARVIGFNSGTTFDVKVDNKISLDATFKIINSKPRGGTSFTDPLRRTIAHILHSRELNNADIVMITDGEGEINVDVELPISDLTKNYGVGCFVIGIGKDFNKQFVLPIATSIVHVHDFGNNNDVVTTINLDK